MVSFNVTSMYTNISIIDMLNIIKDYGNNHDLFTRKTAISQCKFFNLVKTLATLLILGFTNKLIALGRPRPSITAEIYTQAHEKITISTALHLPNVWKPLMMMFIPSVNVRTWKTFSSHQKSSSKH